MAKFNITQLENRIGALNEKMLKEGENHDDYKSWEQSRNYYVAKLTEMDENDLLTIEI